VFVGSVYVHGSMEDLHLELTLLNQSDLVQYTTLSQQRNMTIRP
jgi:hypothetical protein